MSLPTTEPDRRAVPLDLFPTGRIDSIQVSKTYTPNKPSQFAGGLVEIIPLKLPNETSVEAGMSGGWNTLTTGTAGLSYPSGAVNGPGSTTAHVGCRRSFRARGSYAAAGSQTMKSGFFRVS